MKIDNKIENYLNENMMDNYYSDEDEYYPDMDCDLMHRMIDFMMNLNTEDLDEDEMEDLTSIIDNIADSNLYDSYEDDENNDEDEMQESFSPKKVKINPSEKRERKRMYRKNRAQLKLKAKKFRKTAKFKQWKRMMKRNKRIGKTARGSRIRKFL